MAGISDFVSVLLHHCGISCKFRSTIPMPAAHVALVAEATPRFPLGETKRGPLRTAATERAGRSTFSLNDSNMFNEEVVRYSAARAVPGVQLRCIIADSIVVLRFTGI